MARSLSDVPKATRAAAPQDQAGIAERGKRAGASATQSPTDAEDAVLGWRPRHRADAVEYVLEGDLLVYVAEPGLAFSLNSSAHAIWTMCDGSRTVTEIAHELAQEVDCPSQQVRSDVTATISRLKDAGLLAAW